MCSGFPAVPLRGDGHRKKTSDGRSTYLARQQAASSNSTEAATGSRVRQRAQSDLAIAFIEALDDDACLHLAERLRPYLRAVAALPDEWLDSEATAAYLSLPRSTLHKLTAERAIPFAQDGPGCKLYFKRSTLDAWREGGGSCL
jgi:excisionase family DNA binding protein